MIKDWDGYNGLSRGLFWDSQVQIPNIQSRVKSNLGNNQHSISALPIPALFEIHFCQLKIILKFILFGDKL